jgi:hypothetical protein
MLWIWWAGCELLGGGGSSAEACRECLLGDGSGEYGWCGATQECVRFAEEDCEYGLARFDSECEQPQRFRPTRLPVDCRRESHAEEPECQRVQDVPVSTFGDGLSLDGYDLGGGFIDGDHLILAYSCPVFCFLEQSGVLSIDLQTGDRTLLSGRYEDTFQGLQEVGSGELPTSLDTVQLAPDGSLIALDNLSDAAEIYRIDPDSGDREVIYQQERLDAGEDAVCSFDGYPLYVGWELSDSMTNLVVGEDETLWLNAGLFNDGQQDVGIQALVALHDRSCEVVTAYSYIFPADIGVGGGAALNDPLPWLVRDGDRILAVPDWRRVLAIDLQSGQRSLLSVNDEDSPLGEGPRLGDEYAVLAPDGALMTDGPEVPAGFVRVDLETGDREHFGALAGPFTFADTGPMFPHPTLEGVYIIAWQGLVLFEPETGNSNVLSR